MSDKFPKPNSLDSMEGILGHEVLLNSEQSSVIELNSDKWEKYRVLRLRSAKTDPQAWGQSVRGEPEKDEAYWRGKLEDPNFQMFAVEMDGNIVAMAGLQQKPDGRLFLRSVYTVPEMRGRGLAKNLIEKVFDEAKARGAQSMWLGVTEGIFAVEQYKKMGFVEREKSEKIRSDGESYNEITMEKKF